LTGACPTFPLTSAATRGSRIGQSSGRAQTADIAISSGLLLSRRFAARGMAIAKLDVMKVHYAFAVAILSSLAACSSAPGDATLPER
jgi:hypothetical protein